MDNRDDENITICHSPVFYPADPTQVTNCNGHVIAVIGNDNATSLPVALPPDAFERCNNVHCLRVPQAAAALVGAPPVPNQGPHGNTVGDLDPIRAR